MKRFLFAVAAMLLLGVVSNVLAFQARHAAETGRLFTGLVMAYASGICFALMFGLWRQR